MRSGVRAILVGLLLALTTAHSPSSADNKYLEVPPEADVAGARATRYANLSDAEVLAELARRRIPHRRVSPAPPGVRLPVRLTGPLHGVSIHSSVPAAQRGESPFEILDARLALALHDFCRILAQHDVVELVHFTIYRPPASTRQEGGTPQTRHPGGMAIDVGALRKRSGQWLSVGQHWPAAIGAKTCGDGARKLQGDIARELMSIVCESADQRLFHYVLTPHFNTAHADHLHLEIKPGVRWFLVN